MQTITPTVVADQLSLEFDWSALPEQKRYRVRDATRKIKECERAAGAAIFEMGMHLKEVRDELEHGQWEAWLEREYRRSHSDATMDLYALVAGDSSLEACQEALDRAQAGDRIENQLAQEIKSNTPGYRLIPDQQKLFGDQQRRRRSAPSEPPAPKFSEGDFAIITLSEYRGKAVTITGRKPERHASQWM